jgi:hypothetical protein
MALRPKKPSQPFPPEYEPELHTIPEKTPLTPPSKKQKILEMFLNPAYSLRKRRVGCKKLFEMGVQPEWCFSREALGLGLGRGPVSFLGNSPSATPGAKTGDAAFDDLEGGRRSRRRRTRSRRRTMRRRRSKK